MHLEMRPSGHLATCCRAKELLKKTDTDAFSLNTDSFLDAWSSDHMNDIRSSLLNGVKHPSCSVCWENEAAGCISERHKFNKRYGTAQTTPSPTPKSYDVKMGSTCNLKCRICGYHSSFNWAKENEAVYGMPAKDYRFDWPQRNTEFWNEIENGIEHIDHLEIYGGEPLMIKEHIRFLKTCVEKGVAPNITLQYSTNGTLYHPELAEEIWPHFQRVNLGLSIDDIGARFEYQRHPANWQKLVENIERLKAVPKVALVNSSTVSIFNVLYISELIKWTRQIGISLWLNILREPNYLAICNFSDEHKALIKDKLYALEYTPFEKQLIDNIYAFLYSKPGSQELLHKANQVIETHDQFRKEDIAKAMPELAKLLQSYNSNK